jgi:hypothetical protein
MLTSEINRKLSVEAAKKLLSWFHTAWQDDPQTITDAANAIQEIYSECEESRVEDTFTKWMPV